MDDKDFKKHLRDLIHGHHHPEEHDWDRQPNRKSKAPKPKPARRQSRRRAA